MTDDSSATNASLRSRQQGKTKMGATNSEPSPYSSSSSSSSSNTPASSPTTKRNSPYLPTPLETAVLLAYPTILVFGALFSVLSPQTRNAAYDPIRQSHVAASAPSYFARKDNVLNVLFVKQGWAWISASFLAFAASHPVFGAWGNEGSERGTIRRVKAAVRWGLVTAWWVLVTQWCFGPPIIDRGFRFTGGKCDGAVEAVGEGNADAGELFTAVACKAAGGRWSGGHDISGHVFLLVLGSCFLVQEVGWVVYRAGRAGGVEERCVVMPDGAVKGAGVEAERSGAREERALGFGGRFVVVVVGLCLWMLLMTAIYFHTWFEKFTGLLVAAMGIYPIYILPRWIPALRAFVGLPGI
ncbi:inositol phospholipid synthesis and fat-storage-inducing TM-domain-containing protein [Annulohypoxylon maeteangense]|uniref:inositol phospholipid synthesis and fat-storage-inducing TM-domain-containing protein n=1 Tax=Annulohypoxylon maeteangense TaxID=1927788 RepID=UPI00200764F1|nr:inositol phospholipid synthesis and fat-storage-inducing TM-domain-containing protein [Annulohypoxylon maeteangense]KAI0887179.1 inositol phospholipid synthesis and fat-storage-inducing TM-domain-containing protein [Annulohypoxylon maeteangense]